MNVPKYTVQGAGEQGPWHVVAPDMFRDARNDSNDSDHVALTAALYCITEDDVVPVTQARSIPAAHPTLKHARSEGVHQFHNMVRLLLHSLDCG
jgi:hypothetical protein